MLLTILGCSGSVSGPDSPASGYLLQAAGAPPVVLDMGGGTLGQLQRYVDPAQAVVLLSHLHADHCLDVAGLLVWLRYHPVPCTSTLRLHGPSGSALRLGAASSEVPGEVDDISDAVEVHHWVDGGVIRLGELTVRSQRVWHPCEAYGLRITDGAGTTLVYTGDTALRDDVVELARGASVLLAEASWTHADDRPVGVHMSGTEVGRLAQRAEVGELLITHVPPWTSREAVLAEARAEFDGPVRAVGAREQIEVTPAETGGGVAGGALPGVPGGVRA
ncbi:MBL fold metallo-hydrolase [Rhodococcus aerolatus]